MAMGSRRRRAVECNTSVPNAYRQWQKTPIFEIFRLCGTHRLSLAILVHPNDVTVQGLGRSVSGQISTVHEKRAISGWRYPASALGTAERELDRAISGETRPLS